MGSKECPALEEIQAIKASPFSHTVLIDDHRSFVQDSYPAVEELEAVAGDKFMFGCDAMIWQKRWPGEPVRTGRGSGRLISCCNTITSRTDNRAFQRVVLAAKWLRSSPKMLFLMFAPGAEISTV